MESIDAFIDRLPKVELHLHLVGSASVPTVCPTSNACTRQVGALAEHPLPRMLADGLFVTLNSDDPPMFGTTLTEECRRAASVLGLSRAQLANPG